MLARALTGVAFGLVAAAIMAVAACSSFSSVESVAGTDAGAADGASVPSTCDAASGLCVPLDSPCDAGSTPACDAGNAACDAGGGTRACGDRYIFVTAGTLPGNFAADGGSAIGIADDFCASEARRQTSHTDLEGRRWRAWICLDADRASGRAGTTDARWISPDGRVIFDSLMALHESVPRDKIDDAIPWTGCMEYGEPASSTCGNWTSSSAIGNVGLASARSQTWSGSYMTRLCSNAGPIYCFEE